jgi:hypothetical protein
VGKDSVDVLDYLQWAALGNGMNYRPRPVFQGYTAYNSALQQLNKRHFMDPGRPRFVLLPHESIDNRFPSLDDSAALTYVLDNCVPVGRDGKFLILRQSTSEDLNLRLVHAQSLRFGEVLDIRRWSREPLFMSISVKPTLLGRFMAFIYQPKALDIQVMWGAMQEKYRLIPGMAELPFLLNPVLKTNYEIGDLYDNSWRPVDRIVLKRPGRGSSQYPETYTMRLYTSPGFPRSRQKLLSGMPDPLPRPFLPVPVHMESVQPIKYVDFHGSPGFITHAPGKIIIDIPDRTVAFTGFLGILEEVYGNTDGVGFLIETQSRSGSRRRVFNRVLRPSTQPADRGKIPFKVLLDGSQDTSVILTTDIGPGKSGHGDWSVWAECRFSVRAATVKGADRTLTQEVKSSRK